MCPPFAYTCFLFFFFFFLLTRVHFFFFFFCLHAFTLCVFYFAYTCSLFADTCSLFLLTRVHVLLTRVHFVCVFFADTCSLFFLHSEYLCDAATSPINVDCKTREEVELNLKKPGRYMFDSAQVSFVARRYHCCHWSQYIPWQGGGGGGGGAEIPLPQLKQI